MELAAKILLSILVLGVAGVGLQWIWSNQIDVGATARNAANKAVAPPDWLTTRHPDKLYQNGKAVADVTGPVTKQGATMVFSQLANTGLLAKDQPFEYQRHTVRIVRIGKQKGMKGSPSGALTAVLEGVECQLVN
jgi:hypothetical protein